MGMPITIEIVDKTAKMVDIKKIFDYFRSIDERFSFYQEKSETSKINRNLISEKKYSKEMIEVLELSKRTEIETNGFFCVINKEGKLDPSGLVKGWSIYNAAKLLEKKGYQNFYIDAGGDVELKGLNSENMPWTIGIRNPFSGYKREIVKKISLSNCGIATSGNYIRGNHIYNPKNFNDPLKNIVSFTVIGPNVYEADRFATAAFAMGERGIFFIEKISGLEGYAIDKNGLATMTKGFEKYVLQS